MGAATAVGAAAGRARRAHAPWRIRRRIRQPGRPSGSRRRQPRRGSGGLRRQLRRRPSRRRGLRAGGRGYDDGYGDPRGQRGASGSGGYDDDHDEAPPRGGTRRPAAAPGGFRRLPGGGSGPRRGGAPTGPAVPLGQRLGIAFAIGAVPSLIVAFLCGAASAGGSSRSIAGVTLNSQLLTYSALAIPATMAIIAGLLHWRRITPLGLTWGFTVVAGLSWLSLLFAAQVKNVIPHLTPLLTVPLVTGLAVLAGAYLTDENTPPNGRYACLAAVIASHIGIVAIVVTIVLA
ncbi:hypothetical protein ACFQ9X_03775 [Catenulispora yoronensis]